MRHKITLDVSFKTDSSAPTSLAQNECDYIRQLLENMAQPMDDIMVDVRGVEDVSVRCPRCGKECDNDDMNQIEDYWGKGSNKSLCENCQEYFRTLLERALVVAREEAEYQFEREGSW